MVSEQKVIIPVWLLLSYYFIILCDTIALYKLVSSGKCCNNRQDTSLLTVISLAFSDPIICLWTVCRMITGPMTSKQNIDIRYA